MTFRLRIVTAAVILQLFAIAQGIAQTPADDFAREKALQEQTQRIEALKKMTPQNAVTSTQEVDTLQPAAGKCFAVDRVEVEGISQFSAERVAPLVKPYEKTCVGLAEINAVLRDLTYLYLDKGFITSRAYVPEQDIGKTRLLRLVVVEGRLADIYLNGHPAPKSHLLATAFPALRGTLTNIRDVEQGLDQINRLASNNAKTAMLPGKNVDTSILNVENNPGFPLHFSTSNSNLGQYSTGLSKSAASITGDSLLGLNEQLSLAYEHSGPDYPWGNDGHGKSDSYSGSFSIPYGYWTFSANGSWYEYKSSVPANFSTPDTSGDSGQAGIGVDRVVGRDKDSITTVKTSLTYKQTNNFMLGSKIDVGTRQYTVGSLGISHSRRMGNGFWVFDASFDQGIDLFGSVEKGEPGAGEADPRFSKFSATINATRPFELVQQRFELSSTITGQYSPDNLFGAEQISLGSSSNVRGAREAQLFGNNGFFVRNELLWRITPWQASPAMVKVVGELRPYVGIDYGHIYSRHRFGVDGGDITGWTGGIRTAGGRLGVDIGYSDILASSTGTGNGGLLYFNTSLRF
ncbi:ShlB/FhaC/HecB family hemolysin secretion/activation protein [Phyllobacterium endophyticum]|uniref:ShlB/FhaC/HecB family hemolysin secretion/activation protein n=1 Tax=Phyllobacterium endophyticum TaxID=1149773 RepID=A0A2P7B0L1_9HYPH|nr:ShlB/FhaC/HecB family hemolysin secretion/activation protein [Phyllobacterium endophyticum]MBB3235308.1 hemolysin activation/secretion protein [Phyllobacterium endophyticum]PSH60003.1 ShlB/FhaC/HecB family hemolysin secretion/activation protein [Phyllobacterium endophyticum]TYR42173.1 ShlB/FhaC/HecB family hemolysin secretion/activation protein [Phyllobacterium endophyticum]